jgi:hypothetical protein
VITRRRVGILFCILALLISSVACFGITQATVSPPTQLPTNSPAPTDTLITVIPTTVVVASPTVEPTAEEPLSGQVNITEINGFKDEADHWYFYGLVKNDSNRNINDIQIEVKLLDSAGLQVYSYKVNSILYNLTPGEISPFSDFTIDSFPNGKTMQATVVGYNSTDVFDRANLEFRGITLWVDEYNDIYLAGEIINGNASPVGIQAIAGTLADHTGKLVTAAYAYPFMDYLEPNSSGPFSMMFDAPPGQAEDLTQFTLYSDGLIVIPSPTYDISISNKHFAYQDIQGDMHLIGSATNNTSQPMSIYLVAGAYGIDGNCIDASSVYVPYFPLSLNPGETLPYDFTLWGALDFEPDAYNAVIQYKVFINWKYTSAAPSEAIELSTKADTNSFEDGVGYFNGTVVNNSGQDLTTVIVTIAIYDKTSGDLIATNYSFVPEAIPNNGTGSYEVYMYPPANIELNNVNIVITAIGQ